MAEEAWKGVGYEHTYHLHISITPNKQLMKPTEPRNYLFETSLKALDNIFFPPLKKKTKQKEGAPGGNHNTKKPRK